MQLKPQAPGPPAAARGLFQPSPSSLDHLGKRIPQIIRGHLQKSDGPEIPLPEVDLHRERITTSELFCEHESKTKAVKLN